MWDQLDTTISDFIVNQLFLSMFRASLRPSSGGQTAFSLHMARNMLRNNLLTIKPLFVASSWCHIYLQIYIISIIYFIYYYVSFLILLFLLLRVRIFHYHVLLTVLISHRFLCIRVRKLNGRHYFQRLKWKSNLKGWWWKRTSDLDWIHVAWERN
jgi:hypothetical protein